MRNLDNSRMINNDYKVDKVFMTKMNLAILYIPEYPNTVGGGEIRYYDVVNGLIKHNFQVSYINMSERKSTYLNRIIFFTPKVIKNFLKNKYDVIEISTELFYLYPLCLLHNLITKSKTIIFWHEYFGKKIFALKIPFPMKLIAYSLEFLVAKHGKYHLCISEFTANRLKKHIWKNGYPHLNKIA